MLIYSSGGLHSWKKSELCHSISRENNKSYVDHFRFQHHLGWSTMSKLYMKIINEHFILSDVIMNLILKMNPFAARNSSKVKEEHLGELEFHWQRRCTVLKTEYITWGSINTMQLEIYVCVLAILQVPKSQRQKAQQQENVTCRLFPMASNLLQTCERMAAHLISCCLPQAFQVCDFEVLGFLGTAVLTRCFCWHFMTPSWTCHIYQLTLIILHCMFLKPGNINITGKQFLILFQTLNSATSRVHPF